MSAGPDSTNRRLYDRRFCRHNSILLHPILSCAFVLFLCTCSLLPPNHTWMVTAAWASSTTTSSSSTLSGRGPSYFRTTSTTRIWGHYQHSTNPFLLQRTHRGGSQDPTALSMTIDATTTTTTTDDDAVLQSMERAGLSRENYQLLSERGQVAIRNLIQYDDNSSMMGVGNDQHPHQNHVYQNWPPPGTQDEDKIRLTEQVRVGWPPTLGVPIGIIIDE
jgi:hypothetical protein